jgi:transposase
MQGRPSLKHSLRTLWEAVQYIAATGCQCEALPKDFPPFTTVQHHFYRWRDSGLLELINEALVVSDRGPHRDAHHWHYRQPVGQDQRERRPARL